MESFTQTFFSENPEFDIWNNLKNFSYIEYVKKYFKNRNIEPDIKLLDTISGSISQAFEYFEASKVVSIQTAPLMLYYGTINLLFGASCLISGHGLALNLQTLENHSLLNVEVDIKNNQGAGFAEYLEILSKQKISQKHTIKLEDIFASIPELFREYIDINENRQLSILPLIKLIDDELEAYKCQLHYTQYHHIKKIETSKKYEQTFLPHQKNYKNELIFYVRLGKNESIKTSFLGEFFFQLEINETLVIEPIFLGVIGLYTLATLSRYYTDYWNSFIKNNKDGLINFIEKFLNFMRRYLPNYILDIIEDKKHIYTNHVVPIEDLRSNLSEKHIEERIKRIIQENIRS